MNGEYWILLIIWSTGCLVGGYSLGWIHGTAQALARFGAEIKAAAEKRRLLRAQLAAGGKGDTHNLKH